MNELWLRISEIDWQKYTGEVKRVEAGVELTPEFVKKVNEISNGNVFFEETEDGLRVTHAYGRGRYYKAEEKLRKLIENFVMKQIEKGNYERVGTDVIKIKEPITPENVDLTEFSELIKKIEEEIKKDEEIEQRMKELRKKLEEKLSQKVDNYKIHSNGIDVTIKGVTIYVPYRDLEDALKEVENIEEKIIEKLTNELEKCKRDCAEIEAKYEKLCEFIKAKGLKNDLLEFLREEREKEVEEEIADEFPEVFDP